MSDHLKTFIDEHRREFDTNEPGKELWDKISTQLDTPHPLHISSTWLSKFKYLGFSASILIIALYVIITSSTGSSENGHALRNKFASERKNRTDQTTTSELKMSEAAPEKYMADRCGYKHKDRSVPASPVKKQQVILPHDYTGSHALNASSLENAAAEPKATNTGNVATEKKEHSTERNKKKPELYIPEEPEQLNTYTATLYENTSLCALLHAYKFPGKVSRNKNKWNGHDSKGSVILRTMSCGDVKNNSNIKAVWLKGRTDKEITLSLKRKFKDIVLLKRNGREISPEAISHYYPGRGMISECKGKYFNMIFKNKVDLILLFKDVEEGDKIIINGGVEAVVKNKP